MQNLDKHLDTVGMSNLVLYTLLLSTFFLYLLSSCRRGCPGTKNSHPETGHESETGGTLWTSGRTLADETTGSWGTSGDHAPINQDTQPPPVSIAHLSIQNNMKFHSAWLWPHGPAPVNAAELEFNWNIVWIQFSGIQIYDWTGFDY